MDSPVFYVLLSLGCVICGYRSMASKSVLSAALYLACVSALVAAMLYMLGAHQVAVIELSVGAGLVTVLMLYAISVIGDDAFDLPSLVWRPLAFAAVLLGLGLVAYQIMPLGERMAPLTTSDIAYSLWGQRNLDVWIQMVLIFSGVVGTLGLVAERSKPHAAVAATVSAPHGEDEIEALEVSR